MLGLAFRRIRTLADPELQIYLAAVFAPIFAMFFMSFEGPVTQSQVLSPFYWFALGVAGYWLAGPGWQAARRRRIASRRAPPSGRGRLELRGEGHEDGQHGSRARSALPAKASSVASKLELLIGDRRPLVCLAGVPLGRLGLRRRRC